MLNRRKITFPIILLVIFSSFTFLGFMATSVPPLKSYKQAVEAVINAYQNQSNMALQSCYKKSWTDIEVDTEIEFEKKFYLAVGAKRIDIVGVEKLLSKSDYVYIGASLNFIKSKKDFIPYYEYITLRKTMDGTYCVVTEESTPRDVIDYFNEYSKTVSDSRLFQEYKEKEKSYVKHHPEYADRIYGDFTAVIEGIPRDMKNNLQFMGIIFLIAILQLGALYCWSYFAYAKRNQYMRKRKRKIKKD